MEVSYIMTILYGLPHKTKVLEQSKYIISRKKISHIIFYSTNISYIYTFSLSFLMRTSLNLIFINILTD